MGRWSPSVAAGLVLGLVLTGLSLACPTPARAAAALPAGLHFGLGNNPGDLGWMTSSGVPWRYRYAYLSAGVNTGVGWETWNSPPGQYAASYMQASAAHGYLPVFSYYELLQSNPSIGSTESDRDFSNLNNAATMNAYYANFILLMQKAHAFGGQVIVHVEPDLWGYLEQRANNGSPASLSASVQSSGHPDLAGIPDTAQGFADALLHLRDRYAPNVLMATHASLWATMRDLGSDTDPLLDPNVVADQTAAFLNAAAVGANAYGSTFDLIFNDVADHDSGWSGNWWDPTNAALPNFSRWLIYMARLHTATGRPLIVWQVPVGNQYFLTMNNTDGHYQDNRAQYVLAHPQDVAAAGIAAVLFGKANGGQTNYTDDKGDGLTNNNGLPTSSYRCAACNTHPAQYADDDGGYLRLFVGAYYAPPTPSVLGPGGPFHPLAPARILDTRDGTGGFRGPLGPGQSLQLQVSGAGGVPSGAYAAVLNVTATDTTQESFLTVYPGDAIRPATSSLNWRAGFTVPNLVEVRLSASGAMAIYNAAGQAHVVADVAGWVSTPTATPGAAGLYVPVVPARILDTRDGTGGTRAPIDGGTAISLQASGQGGVPTIGASAVVLNITATDVTAQTFVTAWPHGRPLPVASNLNLVAGQTAANRVVVILGAGGRIDLFNAAGRLDLVVDVGGWFTDGSQAVAGATFVGVTPSRILDTRDGTGGLTSWFGQRQVAVVQVSGRGGVPPVSAAIPPRAVVVNLTVTNGTTGSFLTVWPEGAAQPISSDLNWVPGLNRANLVIVRLGPNGTLDVYNAMGSVDVLMDVVGWLG